MWRLLHGRTPTFNFFYNLNLDPHLMCPLCGIHEENTEHIIWECRVSRQCWQLVEVLAGVNLGKAGVVVEGTWLMRS